MKYNKLVRDRIPEMIEKKGEKAVIRIADAEEYFQKLKEKLREEVEEFFESQNEEEMADILEVISAICDFRNIEMKQLERLRDKKAKEKGRFEKRIIMEEVLPAKK